ncbi:DDE-type integrase/transposase/recombinase [Luteimonas terricola]|uniref:Integrase n=1 Tax=Luteimonas terricola TaxID=645597 RepID=A0ABQ2EEX5_9GAMM|nr:DDE-type integrase/transposase/recombinase [Luteimonas terricola]GGK08755.1 integrase [Luteimonas terricola]
MADGEGIIQAAAVELLTAPHGGKRRIAERLADQLGVSVQTAYRRLNSVTGHLTQRKRRVDAGASALQRHEAMAISAYIEATRRETGTGAATLEDAVEVLRANGVIAAGRVDTDTGEFLPLSASQVRRQLRLHSAHPEQLAVATPAARLSSPHPNWCWQIDASVSRQYYLSDDGTRIMDRRTYYRGKPKNFAAIEQQRIWRYAVTDHASGGLEVFYVQGAESSANFLAALIHTMTERSDGTMHGVPRYLMSDPGSAVTAKATRNLCSALGIELIVNEPGNARAKGQVEQAHYLIETGFESGLKMRAPVCSIEEMNGLVQPWARHFNATRVHSRTGLTRRDAWLRITSDQLVFAPEVPVLRQLANSDPKACTVRDWMIRFRGRMYDLRDIPGGVNNGERVEVVRNAIDADNGTVRVLRLDADGRAMHYLAPEVGVGEFGFLDSAAEIGTEFKAPPATAADTVRNEIDRLAMAAATDAEAKARRKAKALPFGGSIDPLKHVHEAQIIPALPRAGRASDVLAPEILQPQAAPAATARYTAPVLSHLELAQHLRERMPGWTAAHFAALAEAWPDGATEDQLEQIERRLAALLAPAMRAVG